MVHWCRLQIAGAGLMPTIKSSLEELKESCPLGSSCTSPSFHQLFRNHLIKSLPNIQFNYQRVFWLCSSIQHPETLIFCHSCFRSSNPCITPASIRVQKQKSIVETSASRIHYYSSTPFPLSLLKINRQTSSPARPSPTVPSFFLTRMNYF